MHPIFDSHAHYDNEQFNPDRNELLASLPQKGIGLVLNAGCDIPSSVAAQKLSEEFAFVYASAGVHPHEAKALDQAGLLTIERLCGMDKVVALGEIGLDYHYDYSPREVQIAAFESQLALAKELDLPVIIHSREAAEETFNLVKKYRPKGVVHCFSGSAELAVQYAAMGLYIGFTGVVTFQNAKKPLLAAKAVPAHLLVIETDCPYMAPTPNRGQRCDSTMLPQTANAIALARGIDTEELIELTYNNAKRLFEIN